MLTATDLRTSETAKIKKLSQADGRPPCVNGDIAIQREWSNFDPHRIQTLNRLR